MARISRRYPTLAALLKDGTLLAAALSEDGDNFSHLQSPRERLEDRLERLRGLMRQVDALQAQKQGLVHEMHGLQDEAAKLMSFLHLGVKNHYGERSEQLAKFGLKPFRGLKRPRRQPQASGEAPGSSGAAPEPSGAAEG